MAAVRAASVILLIPRLSYVGAMGEKARELNGAQNEQKCSSSRGSLRFLLRRRVNCDYTSLLYMCERAKQRGVIVSAFDDKTLSYGH